jgi:hypothetical protein
VLTPIADEEPLGPSEQLPVIGDATGSQAAEASRPGSNLDIVLPGDDFEPDLLAPGAEAFVPEPLGDASLPSQAAAQARSAFSSAAPSAVEELDEESLLEPEADAEPAIPTNATPDRDRRSVGFDDLDILPDLDGFSDSFTASEFAAGGASGERTDSSRPVLPEGPSSARQGPASGMDPASLAQAVRTILKRDQKG